MPETYHKEMNINEWASMFKAIYFPTQNYSRSKLDIFTHLVKVFGGGSKYLFRTSDPDGSRDFLAKIFGWYCALANRLNVDIEHALWSKYPRVCPRCVDTVCSCKPPLNPVAAASLEVMARQKEAQKPRSLREWQNMFANIYRGPSGAENVPASRERLAVIFSRMAEELGEVAETLLLDDAIDKNVELVVRNEMADLGAWIFALANNLQYVDPSATGVTLADVAWNLYGGACHRCHKLPCVCAPGSFGLELASLGAMGQSHWDDRTGLANGEALRVHLKSLDEQFKKAVTSFSFIMFDLDDFGKVNKEYGNLAGDEVLKFAANRMRQQLADKEYAFRRGGEEFVVILQKPLEAAQVLSEKIRLALAEEPVTLKNATLGDFSIKISASFGVANTIHDQTAPSKLEELADERMREAKTAGKNRVRPSLSSDAISQMVGAKTFYE